MAEHPRLTALIKDVIHPTLKPLGYRKAALVWTRELPGARHQIRVQRHAGEHRGFYLELAASAPELQATIGERPPGTIIHVGDGVYCERFERVTDWPHPRYDFLPDTHDADVHELLRHCLCQADAILASITDAHRLAAAIQHRMLDLDLYAWWWATGNDEQRRSQFRRAQERFGPEDRWTRIQANFAQIDERYER